MTQGLNLGCGSKLVRAVPPDVWVNTDIMSTEAGVYPHDLEQFPWPWAHNQFDRVLAHDVFEHISPRATCGFMSECWRVLRPGGELDIRVPHWQHPNAWTDPTHYRGCTGQTFDYWIVGTELFSRHNAAYGGARFVRKEWQLDGHDLTFLLVKQP